MFFVISGFLITGIIIDGARTNAFDMPRFYARRIRRIFPALFSVLLSSSLFAVVAFEPEMYQRFFNELRFAILQISNFLFSQELGYFDASTETSPLLHTWSLGVEEQFYLIWPILILAIFKFAKKRLGLILSLISVLSFICSEYLVSSSPQQAFYMLHSRAWELGVGGILASGYIPQINSKSIKNNLSFIGGIFLLLSFFALNDTSAFPGKNALLPVFGTALLIYTGTSQNTLIFKILSWRPFVFIGALSYSLYLWHWPVIIFYKTITGNKITLSAGIGLLSFTFLLSILSYYFIERPCRYGSFPKFVFLASIRKSLQKSIVTKSCYYLCLFIGVPTLLTWLFLPSTFNETNAQATTMTIEVHLVASSHSPDKEEIKVYWAYKGGVFSEKDSSTLAYSLENQVEDNLYRFEFVLPILQQLSIIRLDPLLETGVVEIVNVSFTGGLFNSTYHPDMRAIKDSIGSVFVNVNTSFTQNTLVVESIKTDPYFILFRDTIDGYYDKEVLFVLFFFIMIFVSFGPRLLTHPNNSKNTLVVGITCIFITLIFSFRLQYSNHSKWRFVDVGLHDLWQLQTPRTNRATFPKPEQPDVILIGDSHAGHYALPVSSWSKERGLSFEVFAIAACPPLLFEEKNLLSGRYLRCSDRYKKKITKILANPNIKYIFLAMRQDFYFRNSRLLYNEVGLARLAQQDLFENSCISTVNTLANTGKTIIILGEVPLLKENPRSCLGQTTTLVSLLYRSQDTPCDIDNEYSNKFLKNGRDMFQRLATTSGNVYYFDPTPYISSIFDKKDRVLYFDDNHLNHNGSILLQSAIAKELENL